MRYILTVVVDTEDDREIEEVFLEGDGPISKYLELIGNVGGDFLKLVVHKERDAS